MISANGVVGRIPTNTAPASVFAAGAGFLLPPLRGGSKLTTREEREQGARNEAPLSPFAGREGRHGRRARAEEKETIPSPLWGAAERGGQERGTSSRRAAARRDPDGAQRSSGRGRRRARRECRARTVRTVSMTDTAKATGRTVRRSMQTTRNIISHTVRTATATRAAARRSPDGAQRSSGEVAAAPSRVSREAAQRQRERPLSCGLSPQSEGRYPAARSAGAGPLSCGPATLQSRAILRGSMPCGGVSAILGECGARQRSGATRSDATARQFCRDGSGAVLASLSRSLRANPRPPLRGGARPHTGGGIKPRRRSEGAAKPAGRSRQSKPQRYAPKPTLSRGGIGAASEARAQGEKQPSSPREGGTESHAAISRRGDGANAPRRGEDSRRALSQAELSATPRASGVCEPPLSRGGDAPKKQHARRQQRQHRHGAAGRRRSGAGECSPRPAAGRARGQATTTATGATATATGATATTSTATGAARQKCQAGSAATGS